MNRSTVWGTAIVVAHLLLNIMHGRAHRELRIGLTPIGAMFVIVVVLILPLVAAVLLWTAKKRLGLMLLSLAMLGAFLFGWYHHFLAMGSDHVHSQPPNSWGLAFVLTSWGLLLTEAMGTYAGAHFLWIAKTPLDKGDSPSSHA